MPGAGSHAFQEAKMVQKKTQIKVTDLSRFLLYMLGRRPDEFGLVPDKEGWLSFKEILWALHEEPGWSHVREIHLREVLMGKDRACFEWEGERVKAVERRWRLDTVDPAPEVPKILFVGVRRRAHSFAMEKGLASTGFLVLSPHRAMAMRVAGRRDPKPVILEIATALARNEGVAFHSFGDLFLTSSTIPPSCMAGPPLSEEDRLAREERKLARVKKEKPSPVVDFTPGSFVLDPGRDPDRSRQKGRKQIGWKERARKVRREKG
jgi:putative RNA 2'-phosphotransferase